MPQVIRDIFEKELKDYFGVEDVIVVNSGTSALIATLLSLDLDSNSEIITSPFTFIATGNSILFGNSNPVFVDIKEDSKLIDEDLIESKINENTKAILPVHLYGRVCNMPKIQELADKYNLIVIEDAAQAFGAMCDFNCENSEICKPCNKGTKKAGTFGDAGCFSFYKTKNFSTFEGGMITINKESKLDAEKIRAITNQGQVGRYNHEYLGFNFRLAEPLCLIGLENLKIHKEGFLAELGLRDESKGHYPEVIYNQPIYKKLGINGNCPVAEKEALNIKNNFYES
tara:strand:- start:5678 stop:6532 length:855 start_codon:yes stop_codon:yes gene_type:complete